MKQHPDSRKVVRQFLTIKKLQVPAAFLLVILIWTATPLTVQWSSGDMPLTSVFLRMLIGVLFCMLLMGLMTTGLPYHTRARRLYVVSGFAIFSSMSLVYLAAQSIPSGWIAVLFGLSPLITGIISAFVEPDSEMTPARLIGVLLGFAGLSLVFRAGLGFDEAALTGISILLCGVIISASSSVLVRHYSKNTALLPTQINVGSLLVAIPMFALTAWLVESKQPLDFTDRELLSILFLGVIGTGFGFTLYFFLLKRLPASKVALVTLITPITALLLGNLVNDEPVITEVWFGAGLVCVGLVLYEYKPRLGLRKL